MKEKVDMTYRFTWDTEPTDEQLEQLMREVGEDVKLQRLKFQQIYEDNLRRTQLQLQNV